MGRKVIIRVDGGHRVGLGHVIRTMALAAMLKPEFECEFVVGESDPTVVALLAEQHRVHPLSTGENEAKAILSLSERVAAQVVVLDGYGFRRQLQAALRDGGLKVVIIDDLADAPLAADLVINHGSCRVRSEYAVPAETTVLCGPSYALLRPPFLAAARDGEPVDGDVGSVLVCMGGTDSFGVTSRVIEALKGASWIRRVMLVLGAAAADVDLENVRKGGMVIDVYRNLDAAGMVQAFRSVRVAVVTASSLAIEACAVGCGLVVGVVADNQRWILEEVTAGGCAVSVGDWRIVSSDVISHACRTADASVAAQVLAQRTMIDGRSPERIRDAFRSLDV